MTELHCECSHLTVFGGGIFVVPNLVHPLHDIVLFATVLDNPVVVSIVCFLWLVYILLVVWARNRDKEDLLKVRTVSAYYIYIVYINCIYISYKFMSMLLVDID